MVHWGDSSISIYINDSNWIPGSYDSRGSLLASEDGLNLISYYDIGIEELTISLGYEVHCLKLSLEDS